MNNEKKGTRGGAREGGGRKKSDRLKFGFKIDADLKEHLDTVENKSDFINNALRAQIKR